MLLKFWISNLGFVSDFGFRISDFWTKPVRPVHSSSIISRPGGLHALALDHRTDLWLQRRWRGRGPPRDRRTGPEPQGPAGAGLPSALRSRIARHAWKSGRAGTVRLP